MTHDPSHTVFFIFGALYFGLAFYFAYRNYQMTKGEGYWFFMNLFAIGMTAAMIAGILWSARMVEEEAISALFESFFLIASLFLFVAAYTLSKKEHKVAVY